MASGTDSITVSVKTAKQKLDITVKADANVKELKEEVLKHFPDNDYAQLCLIFSGKILKDDNSLKAHNIRHGCAVHLVVRQSRGGPPQTTSSSSSSATATASTSTSSTTSSTTTQSSTTTTTTTGGGGGGGGTSLPPGGLPVGGSMEQQLSQMQQQLRNNPEFMSQVLNNPMMQNLMNSPDLMSSLFQSNPQMRELMDRNPELNRMLNNPDMMRQAMDMMRNPAMFQEMLRSHDRQLSNIESMPGGFNALARMYTEIQEPMMDVAQETLEQQNPFSALLGGSSTTPPGPTTPQGTANTNPLPNPWAASSTTSPGGGLSSSSSSTTASTSTAQTNTSTATATSTTGTASTQSPFASMFGGGGMGGMGGPGGPGGPGMEGMLDPSQLMQNPELLSQMMQSPMMQQSMQMMMSNPQLMEQMMTSNPMFAGNPVAQQRVRQAMQMMQNEDFRRLMSNPEYMRAMGSVSSGMMDLQRLGGLPGGVGGMFEGLPPSTVTNAGSNPSTTSPPSSTTTNPSSTATTTTPSGNQPNPQLLEGLMRTYMQQQQQQGQQQPQQPQQPQQQPQNAVSVEQRQLQEAGRRYQTQLLELESMGFYDRQRNLRALIDTGGDLNAAVNILL